jgi:hypothetical protein
LQEGVELLSFTREANYGDVTGTAFLLPKLKPGKAVKLVDTFAFPIAGQGHRIDSVEFTGDTHGQNWYAKFTGRRLSPLFPANIAALSVAEAELVARVGASQAAELGVPGA